MDHLKKNILKILNIFFMFLILSGCSKFQYLIEQGMGQASLFLKAKKNQDLLEDPLTPKEIKKKIKKIQAYKEYFYKFFQRRAEGHYEKTTILDREAVTYLVTASPFNKIAPKEECFPFVGCFPYLGFFDEKSAIKYKNILEKDNWVTWVRPVYAYSTLGNFSDPILSTFFRYDDEVLAELIFHELFHTLFFIENEVQLNENLANFFSKKMVSMYFNWSEFRKDQKKLESSRYKGLDKLIVQLVNKLENKYSRVQAKNRSKFDEVLKNFLELHFKPQIRSYCRSNGLFPDGCYPLQRKWNNASFAGFLTYEEESQKIENLEKKLGLNLFNFFIYIENKHKEYLEHKIEMPFSTYLFSSLD